MLALSVTFPITVNKEYENGKDTAVRLAIYDLGKP